MPSRIDRYRMKDGVTPLAERYFNPVWQDIDLRIAGLETLQLSWEEAVQAVSEFGLTRINAVLGPLVSDLETASEVAEEKRLAAVSAIERLNAAIAAVPALSINIDSIGGRLDHIDEEIDSINAALLEKADASNTTEALDGKANQSDFEDVRMGLPRRVLPDDLGRFEIDAGARSGQLAFIDGYGLYAYDPDSSDPADGETVVAPSDDDGRWILVAPHWDFVWATLAGVLDEQDPNNKIRTGSASLDFPSIVAGGSATQLITVDGAETSDRVLLTPPATLPNGVLPAAWVSAKNTVTVRLNNFTAAAIDPAAMTYLVSVIKP